MLLGRMESREITLEDYMAVALKARPRVTINLAIPHLAWNDN